MTNIHMYPMLSRPMTPIAEVVRDASAPEEGSTSAIPVDSVLSVVEMSDHAAIKDDPTMRKKEASVRPDTDPPNQMTSPYAMRMIVRFLKILWAHELDYRHACHGAHV